MPLVMRLETAAAKFDRKVVPASIAFERELEDERAGETITEVVGGYELESADMRDLLLEAARRIKELESSRPIESVFIAGPGKIYQCGND